MREAEDPTWSPLVPARRMTWYADRDIDLLRTARAQLVQGAPSDARPGGSHARALATLSIAIADVNETYAKKKDHPPGDSTVPDTSDP
jgi:hypothetical protein